jgi:hypothetical protein
MGSQLREVKPFCAGVQCTRVTQSNVTFVPYGKSGKGPKPVFSILLRYPEAFLSIRSRSFPAQLCRIYTFSAGARSASPSTL